jgi:hypothetical protein
MPCIALWRLTAGLVDGAAASRMGGSEHDNFE